MSQQTIYFSDNDVKCVLKPHKDLMVIEADIGPDSLVEKIMVNSGSSMDIL